MMTDRELINKLQELKTVKSAPALWRAGARERLMAQVEREVGSPFSFAESFRLRFRQLQFRVAPLPLMPALAAIVLILAGAVPFTSAMQSSLPGSVLYPVKRSVERMELSLQHQPERQGLIQLELAARRLNEVARLPHGSQAQARLLRDYNITLGFAQAGLRASPVSSGLAAAYDAALVELDGALARLAVASPARPAYVVALTLTDRLAAESLGAMVAAHQNGQNGLLPLAVSERLAQHIAKVEARLAGVDVKIREFPTTSPSPRVVLESKQAIVAVREARNLARVSLTEARELVKQNEFTLALQKVQEGEDIVDKTEAAVDKSAEQQVEGAATSAGAVTPATDGTMPSTENFSPTEPVPPTSE